MPTKTKPKQPPDIYLIPVTLRSNDRSRLLECLDIERRSEKARQAIEAVESDLKRYLDFMRKGSIEPLPAHIVAALDPIAKQSDELAALLHPSKLPTAVLHELGIWEVDDGSAWNLLTRIHVAANVVIDRLKRQKTAGLHVQRAGKSLDAIEEALRQRFAALRPMVPDDQEAEYEGAMDEFAKICRKYLPAVPTARKRRLPIAQR